MSPGYVILKRVDYTPRVARAQRFEGVVFVRRAKFSLPAAAARNSIVFVLLFVGQMMGILYAIVAVLAAAVILLVILLLRKPAGNHEQMRLMQQQLDSMRSQLGQSLTGLTSNVTAQMSNTTDSIALRFREITEQMGKLSDTLNHQISSLNANVSGRIDKQTGLFGDVKEKVGALEESKKMLEHLRSEIASLNNIFTAPKLRGEFGEQLLEGLLKDRLPADKFAMQYALGGERVDAVILLDDAIIPIDAKFPLDNFRRLAACDDPQSAEAKKARTEFARNVRKHIDDIAAKYIRPDKKTLDFALMYIPAENVYHSLLLEDDFVINGQSLIQYSASKKVMPVSPNSIYAYLQTIVTGLRRLQIEEHAQEVLLNQQKWARELGLFSKEFIVLGTHLRNAQNKYMESVRYLDRLVSQFEMIGAHDLEIDGTERAPLPAAEEEEQI